MMKNNRDWLVIAGGPGISSSYLYSLDDVFEEDNLIFYDQIGTYDCPLIFQSIDQMVDQIRTVMMEHKRNSIGIITHSFGNYLLMEYIKKYGSEDIEAVIMISPCPLLYREWKDSLDQLNISIPNEIIDDYVKMKETSIDGKDLFRLIYPYYTNFNSALDIEVKFNADLCDRISSSVVEFDHSEVIKSLTCPLFLINGEYDLFNKSSNFPDCRVFSIPNIGHYPHLEDSDNFKIIVREIIGDLCQTIVRKYI